MYSVNYTDLCKDKSTNSYVCPAKTLACEDLGHNI